MASIAALPGPVVSQQDETDRPAVATRQFGPTLRAYRQSRQATLRDWGGALGITHTYLSRVENLERNPPLRADFYRRLRALLTEPEYESLMGTVDAPVILEHGEPLKRRQDLRVVVTTPHGFEVEVLVRPCAEQQLNAHLEAAMHALQKFLHAYQGVESTHRENESGTKQRQD